MVIVFNKKYYDDLREKIWQRSNITTDEKNHISRVILLLSKTDSADIHYNLGIGLEINGFYSEAIKEFDIALESNPDSSEIISDKGYCQFLLGDYVNAEKNMKKALEIDNLHDLAFHGLSRLYVKESKIDEAIECIIKAINIDSKQDDYYNDLGIIYLKIGRYHEAEQEFKKALKISKNNYQYYNSLSQALIKQGKLHDAENVLKTILKNNPNDFLAHNNLADLYDMIGKDNEAFKEIEIALRLNPDNNYINATYGIVLLKKGKINEAEKYFRKSIELMPDYTSGHANLGMLLFRKGKYGEALDELNKVLEIEGYNPEYKGIFQLVSTYREILEEALDNNYDSFIKNLLIEHFDKKIRANTFKQNIIDNEIKEYNGIIIVPDTNALIDYPELLYYEKFSSNKQLIIMLTPIVLAELDKLKIKTSKNNVGSKAREVIRNIEKIRNLGNLTDGVKYANLTIKWLEVEPKFDGYSLWLNKDNNDDCILASILELKKIYVRAQIIFVTSDINLSNKADYLKIICKKP